MTLPLTGRRILVTRAAHQASKLSDGLRALGAEPVEVPLLEIAPPASFEQLDRALEQFQSYNWIILTSANAVRAVSERAGVLGLSLTTGEQPKIAVVGQATGLAAEKAGLQVSLVPEAYVAESLAQALAGQVKGARILLARAAVARDVLPGELRAAGAIVDVADAYRNVVPEEAPQRLRSALARVVDAAAFTSSSTVTHLAEAAEKAGIPFPLSGVAAVSIGPITSESLRELGWEPAEEASPSDIPGLLEALRRAFVSH